MSSTIKYWLVANLEIVLALFTVLLHIVIFFIFFIFVGFAEEPGLGGSIILMLFCLFPLIFIIPQKDVKGIHGLYFFMLLVVFILNLMYVNADVDDLDEETTKFINILFMCFWIFFSVVSVIAVWFAHYIYKNFNEVVSRRMLYRNSNVSLFESRLKYTLSKFSSISFSITVCLVCLTAYLLLMLAMHVLMLE